jgi:K+-transporting ATPase ATPase C chain
MSSHLRASLWLLLFTLILCSVLYPLALLGIGQALFRDQAQGSLVTDAQGKVIGSRLIAQPFKGEEYFQPRPSAVAYKADASGASNWAASNPLLRDRVARTLGPIVRYKGTPPHGKTVQADVVDWFNSRPDIVAAWADKYPSSAGAWANADDKHKAVVTAWQQQHPAAVAAWKKDNAGKDPAPADLAVAFFKDNAAAFHKAWPKLIDDETWDIPAVFFDMWRNANPNVPLEEVPADMVMASGSGLDPHITLENARYQLKYRVAAANVRKLVKVRKTPWDDAERRNLEAKVRAVIEGVLNDATQRPLGGLAGAELVNVLEVNLAVVKEMAKIAATLR